MYVKMCKYVSSKNKLGYILTQRFLFRAQKSLVLFSELSGFVVYKEYNLAFWNIWFLSIVKIYINNDMRILFFCRIFLYGRIFGKSKRNKDVYIHFNCSKAFVFNLQLSNSYGIFMKLLPGLLLLRLKRLEMFYVGIQVVKPRLRIF